MWEGRFVHEKHPFLNAFQTCTDSPFFGFTIHHDSFDSDWIQLFIDSFITEIL